MKLFSFLTVSAVTVSADERKWANRPDFILANAPAWWNPTTSDRQLGFLETRTEEYFQTYVANGNKGAQKTGGFMKKHLENTIGMLRKQQERCYPKDGRKRRSLDNDSSPRWVFENNSHYEDMNRLFTNYAKWIRNSLQDTCPNQAERLLKRMNRMRSIWYWQVCRPRNGPIETGSQCDWWGRNTEHPRSKGWLNNYYGKESSQTYIVEGCQGNDAQLICPYGGSIEIVKSEFGRTSKWTCSKGAKSSTSATCEMENTTESAKVCNGKESCDWSSGKVSSCNGVDSYDTVSYKCN